MELTPDLKKEIYRTMLLSRRLDERAWQLLRERRIHFHMSAIGHEAAQAGAGFALQQGQDWVAPYGRDLTLLLTMGLKPLDFMRMLMGRPGENDSGGRQMPGSWSFPPANVISTSGVAAAQMLHAVGIAHGMRIRRQRNAVLASCGEGATSMGEWYEALNWAAVFNLPVVFLVQNNGLALSTRQQRQMARSPAQKAVGLGLAAQKVDGLNPFEVFQAVSKALEIARSGKGPTLVEAAVLRIPPHSSDDDDRTYRTRAEVEEARRQDPLRLLRSKLVNEGVFTTLQLDELDLELAAIVDEAVQQAEQTPYPMPEEGAGPVYVMPQPVEHVSEPPGGSTAAEPTLDPGERFTAQGAAELDNPGTAVELPSQQAPAQEITLIDAIRQTLGSIMEQDERVLLVGMDIGTKGGIFRASEGLVEKFGVERVIDAPLSGAALVGVAIGMALYGLRPLCEVQFADFILPAFNQIVNEAARIHYRSAGAWQVPLVIRIPYGGGTGGGLYHSQSVEAWFTHVPGLKVFSPSNPAAASQLLRAAVQDPNPVLFLEPKRGYRSLKSAVHGGKVPAAPAAAVVTRKGTDVTVVCYGMLHALALQAATALQTEGISVEVVDLQILHPLDETLLLESVRRTGRALILHEDNRSGGFGAEIAARIAEKTFADLHAPVSRLASPDVPAVPFSPPMQSWFMLNRDRISEAIRQLVRSG